MAAPRQFPVELDELKKRFQEYKHKTETDKQFIPDYAHFLSLLGSYPEEAKEVMTDPVAKNIPLVAELKKEIGWFLGQYSVNPLWRGQATTKSIWLQKQLGYTDKIEQEQSGSVDIKVSFDSKCHRNKDK